MILFSKMQGTGNDFIVINCLNQYFSYNLSNLSNFLCNRNFGIGADGVIYVFKSNIADFKMRIFNKDGTEAEMCGNGIRVLGKFLYEKDITTKTELRIETLSGVKNVKLIIENKTVINVKVKMGLPAFEAQKIPAYLPKEEMSKEYHSINIDFENQSYKFNLVSIGNPHCVCFVKDLSKQASNDAYKQLQGQVFKQVPKNVPIGQLLKKAGIAGLALTGKDILDAEGKATNNLVNYLKQSGHPVASHVLDNTMLGVIGRPTNTQDYYLEPRKR